MLCTARRETGDHSHWHVLPSLALGWAQSLGEPDSKALGGQLWVTKWPGGRVGHCGEIPLKGHTQNHTQAILKTSSQTQDFPQKMETPQGWDWGSNFLLWKLMLGTPVHTLHIVPPGSKHAGLVLGIAQEQSIWLSCAGPGFHSQHCRRHKPRSSTSRVPLPSCHDHSPSFFLE